MRVTIKPFGHICQLVPQPETQLELEEGLSVAQILVRLGIDVRLVAAVLIGGRRVDMDYVPADGDELVLMSPIAGGDGSSPRASAPGSTRQRAPGAVGARRSATPTVVVVGGGWAGCAAAVSARKAGARAILVERTDMLLGAGLAGGLMGNNGRQTAALELEAMGGGDLFQVARQCARHLDVRLPGHEHGWLYDCYQVEPAVWRYLERIGVEVETKSLVTAVDRRGDRVVAAVTGDGRRFEADAFVDATGTAGPQANCSRHGNGCVMCIFRCQTFGPRVSVTARAGVAEKAAVRQDGRLGGMTGSAAVAKETVAPDVVAALERTGSLAIPVPPEFRDPERLKVKVCQQYAQEAFEESLWLIDNGTVKFIAPYFPLTLLRRLPGFERARYVDPYAGGQGNSIRFMALAPCDASLKVEGLANLFCAGEKAGIFVGHTEAIVTGTLAGYNAVRVARGLAPTTLPRTTAVGEALAFVREQMEREDGLALRYTFSGSVLFDHLRARGLYTTSVAEVKERVARAGVEGLFARPVV